MLIKAMLLYNSLDKIKRKTYKTKEKEMYK